MQYPIIDHITSAYLTNGWNGLSYTDNANFYNVSELFPGFYGSGVIYDNADNGERYSLQYYFVKQGETISLQYFNYPTGITSFWKSFCIYDLNKNFLSRPASNDQSVYTYTADNDCYIRFSLRTYNGGDEFIYLKLNGVIDEFSSNTNNLTDFPNRLKLPLPHYFPHPVIDALISAADGQHTEEEKEILRHYLTPLGIGGI